MKSHFCSLLATVGSPVFCRCIVQSVLPQHGGAKHHTAVRGLCFTMGGTCEGFKQDRAAGPHNKTLVRPLDANSL